MQTPTMLDPVMLLVPVTLFATAALGFVLMRHLVLRDLKVPANRLFGALVTLYMVQSFLVSLRWGYGIETMRLPIGMIAALIPSCAWIAWRALAGRISRDALWAIAPSLISWAALFIWPDVADILIPVTYLAFGLLILMPVIRNHDAPALTPIGDTRQTRHAMSLIGATLIASAATDAFILYDFLTNAGQMSGQVISVVQTAFVLIIGIAAAFSRSIPDEAETAPRSGLIDLSDHEEVLSRLDQLFIKEGLHRTEDLSLRRLSRRLGLPDRRVSEAVNRLRSVNLSQFVNEYRIKDACSLLDQTEQSVLQIALAVGFASKSNFNREFQRVTGTTPSAWRMIAQAKSAMSKNTAKRAQIET